MPDFILPLLGVIFSMTLITVLSGILANYLFRLAKFAKIPTIIVVILLMGFLGSLGELFIAISTLIINYQEFIVGLAIGVTIGMTLLVGGLSIIYNKGIPTLSLKNHRLIIALNFSVLLFILLISDQTLNRTDGIILLFAYLFYISQIASIKESFDLTQFKSINTKNSLIIAILITIFVIINLFFSAGFAVQQIHSFNQITQISVILIAVALASPFSILPELFFELELSKKGTSRIALSDLITSSITNLSLIVGITAIINPITLTDTSLLNFNLFALAIIIILFNIYAYTDRRLEKKEAIGMIALYFVYLLANFLLVM